MDNKAKPRVAINLDKPRNLLLDLNAMVAFEDETGKSIMEKIAPKDISAKIMRALLWACLLHEDETLTIKAVGKMIHAGNLDDIANQLTRAVEASMPEAEEGKEKSPLAKAPLAG